MGRRISMTILAFISLFLLFPSMANSGSILREVEKEVKAVVGKAMPAVVTVYGRSGEERGRGPMRRSMGSGFFVDRDGYLITAAVVIRGMERVTVVDSKGKRKEGKVIGIDDPTQIALIKVDGDVPGYIELGDTKDIGIGTIAIVIGNIFIVPGNVMVGFVSNVYEEEKGGMPGVEGGAFQITVPVYPGMSGAPVLDADGKAIGMAFGRFEVPSYRRDLDLIYRFLMERDKELDKLLKEVTPLISPRGQRRGEMGGFEISLPPIPEDFMEREWGIVRKFVSEESIGFAIPADVIKRVVRDLKEKGKVVRGYLGVEPALVDERTAERHKISPWEGALVRTVLEKSPAEEAGIKPGDVIIKYGDIKVLNPDHLRRLVRMSQPGELRSLTIVRDGKSIKIDVRIGEMPPSKPSEAPKELRPPIAVPPSPPLLGIMVRDAEIEGGGAYVVRVSPGTPADKAGIKEGDVIVEVDGRSVRNASELQEMARSFRPGQKVELTILRGEKKIKVSVEIQRERGREIEL